jgi:hypothetical protein
MARLYATAKLAIGPDTPGEFLVLLQYSGSSRPRGAGEQRHFR